MYAKNQFFYSRHAGSQSRSNYPLHSQMGYSFWKPTEKIVLRSRKNWGVITVLGGSRTGKSALMKLLAYKFWLEHRKIIVFDPLGEWAKIGEPNFGVNYPDMITDLCVVKDFAFKISEMVDGNYWAQLGYTGRSIPYLMMVMREYDLYNDDPETFFSIIEEIPSSTNYVDLNKWNVKYATNRPNLRLTSAPHPQTRQSLLEVSHFVKDFFYKPNGDFRENIIDWVELVERNQFIIFDFGAQSDSQTVQQQVGLKCAIVLDKIGYEQIARFHPVIFVEEASYFAPDEQLVPYSYPREKFTKLNLKKLRYGMFIFYINQNRETIAKTIVRDKFQLILGRTSDSDTIWREVNDKYQRYLKRPRTFLYVDESGYEFLFCSDNCTVGC